MFQYFCYCRLNWEGNIGRVKGKHREQAGKNIRRQGNRRKGSGRKKDVEEGDVEEG